MRTRRILLGVVTSLAVLLVVGSVFAADRGSDPSQQLGVGWTRAAMGATWESMHDSQAMRLLHGEMTPDAAAWCDAMHGQMQQMMYEEDGMMGAGMTGGMMGLRVAATGMTARG
jgi:hypothetical protein